MVLKLRNFSILCSLTDLENLLSFGELGVTTFELLVNHNYLEKSEIQLGIVGQSYLVSGIDEWYSNCEIFRSSAL